MKKFNESDGLYEHILKGVTAFSTLMIMLFAVFGYFHTIKPVFDREKTKKELAEAIREKNIANDKLKQINTEMDESSKTLIELNNKIEGVEKEKSTLLSEISRLKENIAEYDNRVKELLTDNDDAGYTAVKTYLNFLAREVFNKYLFNVGSMNKDEFNLKKVALDIAEKESSNTDNVYEKEAIIFFKKFVKETIPEDCETYEPIFGVNVEYVKYKYK